MDDVRERLNRKRFALSRDNYGASPLHLAILYEKPEIIQFIISTYPQIIDGPDNVSIISSQSIVPTVGPGVGDAMAILSLILLPFLPVTCCICENKK